jgi:hypothetical protein
MRFPLRQALLGLVIAMVGAACGGDDDAAMGSDGGGGGGGGEGGRLEGITAAHNAVRAATGDGIAPLAWSSEVAAVAQAYADELAANGCSLVHSGSGYGENLAGLGGSPGTAEQVVGLWVGERDCYTYGAFMTTDECTCGSGCGHYTQVVWAGSRRLGCGFASCGGGGGVWVCNYDPPGNVVGQEPY